MKAFADLWDWRLQIADLYARIRANPDPHAAWQTWRATRDALFRTHPQTPLDDPTGAVFRGLDYFPYDPAFRLVVGLRPTAHGGALDVPGGADGTITLRPFAVTDGLAAVLGRELTLYWITGYGGGVFLPFSDSTGGQETFSGGRYLLDGIKGADLGRTAGGDVILDFNFAYCPSCAYSPRWVCPLPLESNRLPAPVRAGERFT